MGMTTIVHYYLFELASAVLALGGNEIFDRLLDALEATVACLSI
jgi:hypothetical protein